MENAAYYPASVAKLIDELAKMPGVGKRSAERLAFHLLSVNRDEAMSLAIAIRDVRKNLRACEKCYHISDGELCPICSDTSRDPAVICVVELPRDVIAIEKTSAYRGVYHVLQGRLAPLDGMGPDQIRVSELLSRLKTMSEVNTPATEVILATRPTVEGDATAEFLADVLRQHNVKITRLARGLASGSDLETTSQSALLFAFQGRREA